MPTPIPPAPPRPSIPPTSPAPPPPPVSVPPAPPVVPPTPAVNVSSSRRSFPFKIIFFIFGLAALLALGITTGLLSKYVPGLGSTTLTYWGLWESASIMRPVLDEFEATHPGIKVNYEVQSPTEYRERLQSNLNQGKGPDIFRIHNTWAPMFRSHLASVPASVFSVADYEKTFYPVTKTDFKLGGSYKAVPLEIDGIAMFINDDLFAKTGLAVPANWDELRDAAIAMSVCSSINSACTTGGKVIISGAALGSAKNIDHWQDILAVLMLQNNVKLANPSANAKAAKDVMDYFTSFISLYHMWDENLPSSTDSFAAGKVGIYFGPSWRVFDIQNQNPNLHFSVHLLPQLPVEPARGEKPITYASYWAEAVNAKSPRQSQAWELVKYLSSPDVLRRLYQQAQGPLRAFGEPYSRMDMADELKNQEKVAPFIIQAPLARSGYLASFTHDGPTGLNTRLSDLFAGAISNSRSISVLGTEINTILSQYGISVSQAP